MIIYVCDVCGRVVGQKEKFYSMPMNGELVDMCTECAEERRKQIYDRQLQVAKRVLGLDEEKLQCLRQKKH